MYVDWMSFVSVNATECIYLLPKFCWKLAEARLVATSAGVEYVDDIS